MDDGTKPPNDDALRAFYRSLEWVTLSYETKRKIGWQCQCCGASPRDGIRIVSDHIRPIRYFWHLRLVETNIQVLCDDCNRGKGSWDNTDYRPDAFRDGLLQAIEREREPSALKDAITTAYSFGAISERKAKALIRAHHLEHE